MGPSQTGVKRPDGRALRSCCAAPGTCSRLSYSWTGRNHKNDGSPLPMIDSFESPRAESKGVHLMRTVLIALGAVAGLCVPAHSQDVAEFYRGKTIRIVVGIGVGSGYDINARLIARFLPAQIPGNPTVIVQNQPGAGSLTMTNQLYAGGPFDGTALGASFNGLPTTPLLQPAGARFEAVKLNWIGSTHRQDPAKYVWDNPPIGRA